MRRCQTEESGSVLSWLVVVAVAGVGDNDVMRPCCKDRDSDARVAGSVERQSPKRGTSIDYRHRAGGLDADRGANVDAQSDRIAVNGRVERTGNRAGYDTARRRLGDHMSDGRGSACAEAVVATILNRQRMRSDDQ